MFDSIETLSDDQIVEQFQEELLKASPEVLEKISLYILFARASLISRSLVRFALNCILAAKPVVKLFRRLWTGVA